MKSPVDRADARLVLYVVIYSSLVVLVAAVAGLSVRVFLLLSGL